MIAIGQRVVYVTATGGGLDHHQAIAVGRPEHGHDDEVHLAVLTEDGEHLNLIAMSVPSSTDPQPGHWHHPETTPEEWPQEDDTQVMETPADG